MAGIFPDTGAGGVIIRSAGGIPANPSNVPNAYVPPEDFAASCALTALPADCTARFSPAQINAIVSELMCFAATLNPTGTWTCSSLCNLATNFEGWLTTLGQVMPAGLAVEAAPSDVTDHVLMVTSGGVTKKATLQSYLREVDVTASMTVASTHAQSNHNISAGAGTITLDAASTYPARAGVSISNNTARGWQIAPSGVTTFWLYPGQICRVYRTGNTWSVVNDFRWQTRTPQTFHVAASGGSDSNDGLTSGSAFATIQRAIDVIEANVDCLVNGPTIKLGAGTHTCNGVTHTKRLTGNHVIYVEGDLATPANVILSVSAGQTGFTCRDWSGIIIAGCTMQSSGSAAIGLACSQHGVIDIGTAMVFGAFAGGIHMSADNGGSIGYVVGGTVTISGDAVYHWNITTGSNMICTGVTITIATARAFTAFLNGLGGSCILAGVTISGAGVAGTTGVKYVITHPFTLIENAVVLPGNVAGIERLIPLVNNVSVIGDPSYQYLRLHLGNLSQINFNGDVTIDHALNQLNFQGASVGYYFDAAVAPITNDGAALGSAYNRWSDVFLASGAVLNFNGDVTITHSADKLVFAGGVVQIGASGLTTGFSVWDPAAALIMQIGTAHATQGYMQVVANNGLNSVLFGTFSNVGTFQNTTGTIIEMQVSGGSPTADLRAGVVSGITGVGYRTGAGGTVTQATSKSTGVTLNTACGEIVMHNAALLTMAAVGFTLTNSIIAATDVVVVSIKSGATANAYTVTVGATAAGSCLVGLRNNTAGTLSEAVVLSFAVVKAVAA